MAEINSFHTYVGLLLNGRIKGFDDMVHLLNIYGPYYQQVSFLDRVKVVGLLTFLQIFLAGDLNFT